VAMNQLQFVLYVCSVLCNYCKCSEVIEHLENMQRNIRLRACFKVINYVVVFKVECSKDSGSFQTSGLFFVFNYRCYFITPLSWVMRVCITGQVYVNVFEQDVIVFY